MSIESDLKKDSIKITRKIETLKVNSIARKVSEKLCDSFPELKLNKNILFIKLSRLDMYMAKMPEGMAEASYFYKNSSIYFNEHISEEDIEEFSIHECIHCIQEVKDKKNYLIKMGLCDYTEFKTYGSSLNEAAVQLMSSKILGIPKEYVKYFNISFETTSPSYYPLECCLVNQLAYLTGENILFDSTINSNNIFKEKLIELLGYKEFMTIQNSLDKILLYEEDIIKINNKILQIDDRNKKVDNMIVKINSLKKSISNTFIKTQNIIISSYFDKAFYNITSLEEIEKYRIKLYNFKDYLGSTDGYTYFNDYYVNKMISLEDKYNLLENNTISNNLSLVEKKASKLLKIIKLIKSLFIKESFRETDINK